MIKNTSEKILCPIGSETLLASIKAGYANTSLGLIALLENGYQPGEIVESKTLIQCGIGKDLAKTIVNQFEGREFDKRKVRKNKEQKTEDKKRKARKNNQQKMEDNILSQFEKDEITQLFQGLEEGEKVRYLYENSTTPNPMNSIRKNPPEPSAVKKLFSSVVYANNFPSMDISPFKAKRGRGRPSRLYVIPTLDEYGKLFGVRNPDVCQDHYELHGHKKVSSLLDAIHFASMEKLLQGKSAQHSLVELCDIQADSPKTIRERNKRTGIKAKHNYFAHPVSPVLVKLLLIKCRGGTWWEVHIPNSEWTLALSSIRKKLTYRRYPVDPDGLSQAEKEWQDSGAPGNFYDCLKIAGYDSNSYILPIDNSKAG